MNIWNVDEDIQEKYDILLVQAGRLGCWRMKAGLSERHKCYWVFMFLVYIVWCIFVHVYTVQVNE